MRYRKNPCKDPTLTQFRRTLSRWEWFGDVTPGPSPPSATTSGLQHKLEALLLFPTAIRGFKAGGPLYA